MRMRGLLHGGMGKRLHQWQGLAIGALNPPGRCSGGLPQGGKTAHAGQQATNGHRPATYEELT